MKYIFKLIGKAFSLLGDAFAYTLFFLFRYVFLHLWVGSYYIFALLYHLNPKEVQFAIIRKHFYLETSTDKDVSDENRRIVIFSLMVAAIVGFYSAVWIGYFIINYCI